MTTAIILAGGLGTRLRSVLPDLPKPMAPVNGRPFLEHLMDYWIDQGVDSFILSVGYMKDVIIEHFRSVYRYVPISYSLEETPLGTGGALLIASRTLKAPFLVLNGDTFFEVPLSSLTTFYKRNASECNLSLFRVGEDKRFGGIVIDESNRIISFDAAKSLPGALANGGVYLFSPSLMSRTRFIAGDMCSLEKEFIPELLALGVKIHGIEFLGRFIDIGLPSDLARANTFLATKEAQ